MDFQLKKIGLTLIVPKISYTHLNQKFLHLTMIWKKNHAVQRRLLVIPIIKHKTHSYQQIFCFARISCRVQIIRISLLHTLIYIQLQSFCNHKVFIENNKKKHHIIQIITLLFSLKMNIYTHKKKAEPNP